MQEFVARIKELLEKREEVYPVQDQSYQELSRAIMQLTRLLLDQAQEQRNTWQPDLQLVEKTKEFIERPVFICGAMKTGTTLLTQLLDNHPALLVMPGDSHNYTNFRDFAGGYEDLCSYWMQRLVNPTGQSPFWFFGSDLDSYLNFLLYLEHFFLKTEYDTFQSVVAATFCANPNRSMTTMHWVEKKPENERYAHWFIKRFPKAKFLHITRDPLPNIASIKKLNEFKAIPFRAISYGVRLKHLMKLSAENLRTLGKSTYQFVRYEDLLTETEKELLVLTTHLGIELDENLFIPSENGVPARANSMYSANRITGSIAIGRTDEKWRDILTQIEKEDIVTILFPQVMAQGYADWSVQGVIEFRKLGNLKYFRTKLMETLIALKYRLEMRRFK